MLALALEGPTYRSEGLGKRKDVSGDEQVRVLCPDRMPIDALRRDCDFGHEIGATERQALGRGATQGNRVPCTSY